MIRIAVLTATRAEYGLMRQLLFRLKDDPEIDLDLLVTGTHLSRKYGMTVNEIIDDGIPIAVRIRILVEKNGEIDVSKTMACALVRFSEYFSEHKYDLLFVDGDRYETLAVCIAAINNNIPIAHCGGGATTEGSKDEYWRHAITKLSYIHFPTTEIYKKRIVRMGENPFRICVSGSPGLENIRVMELGTIEDVETKVGLRLDSPYALVTFHPAISEDDTIVSQVSELLAACSEIIDMKFIFTLANADRGGERVNELLEKYCKSYGDSAVCVASMGSFYYLTAMKYCEFVMGNSSSGLIEAPSFGIPAINIGDRQKGRERAQSVIDCELEKNSILTAVDKARTRQFKEFCRTVKNPNGDGYASEKIIKKIKDMYSCGALNMEKVFFDGE